MKRNYLLVYHNKYTDEIKYQYFNTIDDMKDFIKVNLSNKKYWKTLHKYQIKEVK